MRPTILTAFAFVFFLPSPRARAEVPANGWVVFGSNRQDGRHELYLMKADGSGIERLTFKGAKHPGWSPNGHWIAYTDPANDSTRVMRHTGAGDKKVCDGTFKFWLWDGSGLVCNVNDSYYRVDPDTGNKVKLFAKSDFTKLGDKVLSPGGITHDGRYLVAYTDRFRNGFTADNGTFKAYNAAAIFDLQNKGKLYFFGDGCEPNTPPSGDLIYHVCGTTGECPYGPDPVKMSIKDIASRSSYTTEISHDDPDWGHEYFPRISNDGKWMIYGATTGAHDHWVDDYEIWIHRLGAGNDNRTRITNNPANDNWPHLFVGTLPDFCASATDCDDGNACTKDSCNGQCVHTTIEGCCKVAADCDDGNACTADRCDNNSCQFAPVEGCCQKHADCDDGNACTADSCESNGCQFAPISGCCTKDEDCPTVGACSLGRCQDNVCHFEAVAGCCGKDADCGDGNACTEDRCDTSTGTCQISKRAGCCAFDTDCDDGDACTLDSCDETTGQCSQRAICEQPDAAGPEIPAGDAGAGTNTVGGPYARLEGGCTIGADCDRSAPLSLLLLLLLLAIRRTNARP